MAKKKAKKLTQAQKRELTQRETAKLARRTGPFTAGMVEAGRQTKALLGSVGIGKGVKAGDRTALNQLRKQRPVSTFAGSLLPTAAIPGGILGKGIAARLGVTSGKGAASRANPERIKSLDEAVKRGTAKHAANRAAEARVRERMSRVQKQTGKNLASRLAAKRRAKAGKLPEGVGTRPPKLGVLVGDAFVKSGAAEFAPRTVMAANILNRERKRKKKKVAKAMKGKIKRN